MPVGVLMPSQPRQQETALDKVLKGLNIAQSAFGIAADVSKIKSLSQDREIAAQANQDARAGIVGKKDLLSNAGNFSVADENTPGSIPVSYREGDSVLNKFLTPRKGQLTALDQAKIDVDNSTVKKNNAEAYKIYNDGKNKDNPNAKLDKLNATEKSAVGGIASGFQALDMMSQAMKEGETPGYVNANTPVIGKVMSDTNFTRGQRVISEVVGRLQSGGAINKDEEARFLAMGPRQGDDPDQRVQKINDQREFLRNKLNAYGFDEAGLKKAGFNTTFVAQQNDPNTKYASDVAPKAAPVPKELLAADPDALRQELIKRQGISKTLKGR